MATNPGADLQPIAEQDSPRSVSAEHLQPPAGSPKPSDVGIYLARHGQTAYNLQRRFQGRLDVPLDATGVAQAQKLAHHAGAYSFAALWSSTLLRAKQTALIVAKRIQLPVRLDERLVETDAGRWTDRTFAEVERQSPQLFAAFLAGDPQFAFPGGESFAQQSERVAQALSDIQKGPLPALVVCHGVVIRLALYQRSRDRSVLSVRVANGALMPLDQAQ